MRPYLSSMVEPAMAGNDENPKSLGIKKMEDSEERLSNKVILGGSRVEAQAFSTTLSSSDVVTPCHQSSRILLQPFSPLQRYDFLFVESGGDFDISCSVWRPLVHPRRVRLSSCRYQRSQAATFSYGTWPRDSES